MEPPVKPINGNPAIESGTLAIGLAGGKGGQGCSMLASTLAGISARRHNTILVDLDGGSTHRHLLERENCPGISNLAMVIEELPSREISGFIQRHPHGFDLLPGARNPQEEHVLDPVKLNLIVKLLTEKYEVVLLDISSNHRFIYAGSLQMCSLNLVTVQPDLLSLSCAVRLLDAVNRQVSSSPAPWALIINRESAASLVRPRQVGQVLDLPLLAVLPDDPSAGEDFSGISGAALRRTLYTVAIEGLAELLGLAEGRDDTRSRSLSSRCLRALRTWPAGKSDHSTEGYSCAG